MKFRLVVALSVLAFGACESSSSGSSSSADTQSGGTADTSGGATDTSGGTASDATSGADDTSTVGNDTTGTGTDVTTSTDTVIPSDDDTTGGTEEPLSCSGILQCANKCPQTSQTDFNLCLQDCQSQSDVKSATAFQEFLKCQTTACKDATTNELLQVCMQEKCSDQIYECFAEGDLTCKEFTVCLGTCKAGDQACQGECFSQATPLAGKTYDQITACIQKACPAPATQECANTQINAGGACVDVYAACDAGTEYVDPGTTDGGTDGTGGTGGTDGGTGSTDGGTGATDGTIPPPAMPAFDQFTPGQFDRSYWKMIPSFHAR